MFIQDGLVHISQVCDKFIKHPSEAVSVGDVVKVVVLEVDAKKKRISLSMKQRSKKNRRRIPVTMLTFDETGDALDENARSSFRRLCSGDLTAGESAGGRGGGPGISRRGAVPSWGNSATTAWGVYQPLLWVFRRSGPKKEWTEEDWSDELWTTLSHELTHHMEGLGGLHGLDDRDEEEMAEFREEYRRREQARRPAKEDTDC